jgi:4-methyl-5(b-hydroxyethyl)-thiazole monophosphate biosynthesis
MAKRILCLITDGFEEIEMITPVDLLRRAGADVVIATITSSKVVLGRSNVSLVADALLADVDSLSFDLLLIPGGPGVKALREDKRAATLAAGFASRNLNVAAICAAPGVLGDAGLLAGRKFTGHSSIYTEFPEANPNERVIVDGAIITSRGAGTALDFGLAIVRELFGDKAASDLAASIMA